MASIGIHASHEQVPPSDLLTAMRDAEAAGFQCAWSSDHFSPWSERQGESGFAWAWLGAAMQSTTLPFGVVTAPGQRYHPAIVAQAAATLAELFPGRLSVALGPASTRTSTSPAPRGRTRRSATRACASAST
jgi:alkanesulfonate monooxygenase SsuD/methylene tetrahydromethanopterin reductase-like flavin-dependent oxidoreductase (luciferase family)